MSEWGAATRPGGAVTWRCFRWTNRDKAPSIRTDQRQSWSVCRPEANGMTGEEAGGGRTTLHLNTDPFTAANIHCWEFSKVSKRRFLDFPSSFTKWRIFVHVPQMIKQRAAVWFPNLQLGATYFTYISESVVSNIHILFKPLPFRGDFVYVCRLAHINFPLFLFSRGAAVCVWDFWVTGGGIWRCVTAHVLLHVVWLSSVDFKAFFEDIKVKQWRV